MNYILFKFQFSSAVHFGTGGLTTTSATLMADTVFSALCTEAANAGEDPMRLIEAAAEGKIRISDALPYIGDRFYVPKPLAQITTEKEGESSVKKALKKLTFVPADSLSTYMNGTLDIEKEAKILGDGLGQESLLEKAAVDTGEETRPYAVDLYRYHEGSGLYICLGYECEEDYYLFSDYLEILSFAGIGGKTSSGYGRFTPVPIRPDKEFLKRLQDNNCNQYMSLSVCLPDPGEIDQVLDGANTRLVKRSGWVSPGTAEILRKRRDIYMLTSGSVFKRRFKGCLLNLGGDEHPVYRYAFPMHMGVD